jgi:hypothetical protein
MKPDELDLIDAGIIYPHDSKTRRLLLVLAAHIGKTAARVWQTLLSWRCCY